MSQTSFESWLGWISDLPELTLFFFTVFSNFLENVFPPWPGDTVTVFLGFLASRKNSHLFTASLFFANLLGNWLGAILMYFFGQKILLILSQSKYRILSQLSDSARLEKTKVWFSNRSFLVVLVSRFSAGLRFFVAIVAGMSGMKFPLFVLSFTLGVLVWSGLLYFGGFIFGKNWDTILTILGIYQKIIITLILFGGFFFFFMMHRRKTKEGS